MKKKDLYQLLMLICVLLAILEATYLYDYVTALEEVETRTLTLKFVFYIFKNIFLGILTVSFFSVLGAISFLEAKKEG